MLIRTSRMSAKGTTETHPTLHRMLDGFLIAWETCLRAGGATMHTALLHCSARLWLLASTLLVLVQPPAWAEGDARKVGIVTAFSVDAASRSPALKRLTDAIRASVPGLNLTFEWRSAEGKSDRYPQIMSDLVQQQVDVIFAGPAPAAVAARQVTT